MQYIVRRWPESTIYNTEIYFYLTFCSLNSVQQVTKIIEWDHRFTPISLQSLSDLEGKVVGRKSVFNNA